MLKKIDIYLDTSVPNAYFDPNKIERQKETKEFWNRLNQYEVYISDFVLKEIEKTPQEKRKKDLLALVEPFNVLDSEKDSIRELTRMYTINGAIAIVEYAIHVATAVINKIGILASWNYRHLVKLKTKREVNSINLKNGCNTIEIVDPSML
jgi:predicted nucleic acid-binding protein